MSKHLSTRSLGRRHSTGFSLVELMVSLAIGMVLAIVASTIYLYTKQSYNATTENSQMEENGRFALNLLSKYIQSAGFVMIDPAIPSPQGPIDNKMRGCDFGFVNPTTPASSADLACLAATPAGTLPSASIALFSETDAYSGTGAKYQGFDCVGQSSIPIPLASGTWVNEIRSYFFISRTNVQTPYGVRSMGQLTCVADRTLPSGTASYQSQPLIPGVEQLAFTYLLPAVADPNTAQGASTATAIAAANQWPAVLAVEVCVLTKSIQSSGNDTGTAYTDCYGNAIAAAASESYRTFRTTVRVRNKSNI
ncbi:MAG: PilW family protein [Rhodoferax sp.]|uniref:PilW family protein n=1 Tax=Rhodoferax sp. TaxID=50421 RepID=UPI0027188CDA|nr:PilW family protein [Rhodoferax sp.]MDO8449061.1 PilW family protein [Rhodoferax sp.]